MIHLESSVHIVLLHRNQLVGEGKFLVKEFHLIDELQNHHFVTVHELPALGSDHQLMLRSAGGCRELDSGWMDGADKA